MAAIPVSLRPLPLLLASVCGGASGAEGAGGGSGGGVRRGGWEFGIVAVVECFRAAAGLRLGAFRWSYFAVRRLDRLSIT